MKLIHNSWCTAALLALLAGCHDDRPHDYGEQRPDVGSLHPDDSGIQSKDVVASTDQMTMDLLALPELNDSRTRWTIVATGMENDTTDRRAQYDLFIGRLRVNLARQGRGRVQLIENRDKFRYLQDKELEPTGPRRTPAGPAGAQPQLALHGT